MDAGLERLELRISKFLRAGVIVAGALLVVGWGLQLANGGGALTALRSYQTESLMTDVGHAYATGDFGRVLSYLGLVTLIALPFTRVALTAILFVRRREWILASAAGFVALALVASVVLGIDL